MCIFSAKNSSQIEYVEKTRRSIDVSHICLETLVNELCELYRVKVQQENTKSTRGAKVIRGPHNYFFHSWISSLFFTLQFNRMSFIRTSWPWNIWKKVFFLQPFAESSSPKFIVARLQSRTEIFSSPFFSDVVGVKQSGFFFFSQIFWGHELRACARAPPLTTEKDATFSMFKSLWPPSRSREHKALCSSKTSAWKQTPRSNAWHSRCSHSWAGDTRSEGGDH